MSKLVRIVLKAAAIAAVLGAALWAAPVLTGLVSSLVAYHYRRRLLELQQPPSA